MPSWIPTEQRNPRTRDIDLLPTQDVLARIHFEDATVPAAVSAVLPALARVVERVLAGWPAGGRLIYIGAGTSGRLGVLDAAECPPTYGTPPERVVALIAGGPPALLRAVEGAEDDAMAGAEDMRQLAPGPHDTVVGLSASGGAAYVLAGVALAAEAGAITSCLTCNGQSALAQAVQLPMVVAVGPEVIAGSTRMKAGTAQKLVLNMLTTAVMIGLGKTYENWMVDVQPTNAKLRGRAQDMVAYLADVSSETAAAALAAANYHVKEAVLMVRLGWSYEKAQTALAMANGRLRGVLEAQQGTHGQADAT